MKSCCMSVRLIFISFTWLVTELASRRRSRGLLKEGGYAMSRCKTRQHEVRCGQLEHSSDEEEEKMRSGWHSTRSRDRHQASSRQQSNRRDVNDEYDDGDHNEGDMDEDNDDEEDVNNSAVRRSSRLKKKPFRFRSSLQEEDKRDELDRGKRRRSGDLDNSSEVRFSENNLCHYAYIRFLFVIAAVFIQYAWVGDCRNFTEFP